MKTRISPFAAAASLIIATGAAAQDPGPQEIPSTPSQPVVAPSGKSAVPGTKELPKDSSAAPTGIEASGPGAVIPQMQNEMREILQKFDNSIAKFIDAKQPSVSDARDFIDGFTDQYRDFLTGFGPESARMHAIEDALEFAKQQQQRIAKKTDLTDEQKKPILDQWAKLVSDADQVRAQIAENNAALEQLIPRLQGHRSVLVEYEILRRYGDALIKLQEMSNDLIGFRQKIEEILKKLPAGGPTN